MKITVRSASRLKWAERGAYFARQWFENEEYYRRFYAGPEQYRRATVRECWPHVGEHVRRYLREGFEAELGRLRAVPVVVCREPSEEGLRSGRWTPPS